MPTLAVVVLGGATLLSVGATQVHAQSTSNPFSNLVQMIAQKFNLDQSQVQSVVDNYKGQQKQKMVQNMQQREQDRLNKLVQEGKITDAQKQAILSELAALKTKYNPDNFKNLSADQRKQQIQAMETELKSWAQSQGINFAYVMPGFGMGGMHRPGKWMQATPSATPTP